MTKGVTLLAIGSEGYLLWAVNMACTVKHFSPDLPIQLIADKNIITRIKQHVFESVFDTFTEIEESDYMDGKSIAPGKAKLKLPEYFLFDKTLYLDIDGAVIKDITPLFATKSDFTSHVNATYKLGDFEKHPEMYWCDSSVIIKHYHLSSDVSMPALNTSFYVVNKTTEIKNLFAQAFDNISANPIPREKRFMTWGKGKGMQPDELYLNIACAQSNIYPENVQAIYFRDRNKTGSSKEINALRENYYGIGLYGDEDYNHQSMRSIYNRHVRPIFEERFPTKHFAKAEYLMSFKIANQKF